MKLLVVDHNALEPANRLIYKKIVERGGVDLRLVVPATWFNNFRTITFDPPTGDLNYELFSSKVLFSSRTHRLMYRSLRRHVKEFQPDLLYMNAEPENFQTFQAAMLLSGRGTKFVFSTWRNIDHTVAGYPYKMAIVHKYIEKFVLTKAAHCIAFSSSAKQIFSSNGFPAVTIIPPAVDTNLFRTHTAVEKNEKGGKQGNFVVGYVGRLVRQKGVDLILEVLSQLPHTFSALIVGDGDAKSELVQLASRLDLADRVKFAGTVAHTDIAGLYAQMNALVLPSRTTRFWREQFGRVLVEAMASGVPVLGSDSGEIPAVIGDAGFVFKEDSVDGLRLGIERLFSDETLRNGIIRRATQRANSLFSVDAVAASYHRLFTSL